MNRIASGAVLAAALLVPKLALGQTEGYLGIYADAMGTTTCATIPPWTSATLHVLATPAGQSATGITGAEFRIEVTNPNGWYINYTPPSDATILMGSALDLNPGEDSSGLRVAFGFCKQPGTGGKIPLGTLSVFNLSGDATDLLVKRHNVPSNPYYSCPLFNACDSGHTKVCMPFIGAPPCNLSPNKGDAVAIPGDQHVFASSLNWRGFNLRVEPFTETLDLGSCELWIAGHRIQGPRVQCVFDGDALTIGGVTFPFRVSDPPRPRRPVMADWEFMKLRGGVPLVQTLISQGVSIPEARARFYATLDTLEAQVRLAYRRGGLDAACKAALLSPLVETAERISRVKGIEIKLHGSTATRKFMFESAVATRGRGTASPLPIEKLPRKLVDSIRPYLGKHGGILFVRADGGMAFFAGPPGEQARRQTTHLINGGDVSTMPDGPLRHDRQILREIMEAAGSPR